MTSRVAHVDRASGSRHYELQDDGTVLTAITDVPREALDCSDVPNKDNVPEDLPGSRCRWFKSDGDDMRFRRLRPAMIQRRTTRASRKAERPPKGPQPAALYPTNKH